LDAVLRKLTVPSAVALEGSSRVMGRRAVDLDYKGPARPVEVDLVTVQ
jgi:hypothetical protein